MTLVQRRLQRLLYLLRSYSWVVDPRFHLRRRNGVRLDRPIFLLGTQGGGLTLLSRMLRRHPQVVSAAGGFRYWTSADEMQNVFGLMLPFDFTGLRYKAPPHPELSAPRSWSYAADTLLATYRRTEADATPQLRRSLESIIGYCCRRYGGGQSDEVRFVDKSQVFSVRAAFIHKLLQEHDPVFVLVTRDPYAAVYRAATGGAADMARLAPQLSLRRRLEVCAQHYANTARTVLEDSERCSFDLLILRFEDLLQDPAGQLDRVLDHVGLDSGCRAALLPAPEHRFPLGSRYFDRWYPLRRDVNATYATANDEAVAEVVDEAFGELIDVLGYRR